MKILKSKVFRILILLFLIGIILGIISFFIIDDKDIIIIKNSIINYFDNIKSGNMNYTNGLLNSIYTNIKNYSIIWISGILCLSFLIVPLIIIFNGILISFSYACIISVFPLKGFLYTLILMFPCMIINMLIIFIISYYSIHYSLKVYKTLKYNNNINLKDFIKNYLYILLILSGLSIINSIIEIFFISNVLKYVV